MAMTPMLEQVMRSAKDRGDQAYLDNIMVEVKHDYEGKDMTDPMVALKYQCDVVSNYLNWRYYFHNENTQVEIVWHK